MEVEIALDLVSELLDLDAFHGCVVHEPNAVPERQRLQDELDSIRARIRSQEDRRFIADQLEGMGSPRRRTTVLELADFALVAASRLPGASELNVAT